MLKKFIDYIKINEMFSFGNWEYKLPDDKKEQMYDFYMLSLLLGSTNFDMHSPNQEYPNFDDMNKKEELDYSLKEVSRELLPELKKELLQSVMFSIAAELRHVFDNPGNKIEDIISRIKKEVGTEESSLFKKYVDYKHNPDPNFAKGELHPNLNDSYEPYKDSYKGVLSAGGDRKHWSKLAKWLFKNVKWNSMYSGQKWAEIADGWLKLYNSHSLGDTIAAIDHVYDLQHNTNTVFNKLKSYEKDGSYNWIKNSLDHKRYLTSSHELIEHLSPKMRRLALAGIKIKEGKTWEDFEKEWPEILKKKTAVYNQTKEIEYDKKKAKGELYHGEQPPTPLTPEQFASRKIKSSNSPWSIYKVNEKHKANTPSPYASGPTAPHPYTVGSSPAFKPLVTVFKDANGIDIKVGDTVKKQTTTLFNVGNVKTLNSDGTVTVSWKPPSTSFSAPYEKSYLANQLVVTPTAAPVTPTAAPKPAPVLGGLLDPLIFFYVGDKVSDSSGEWYTITDKNNGKLTVSSPLHGYKVMSHTDVKDHKQTPKPAPSPAAPKASTPANEPPLSPFTAAAAPKAPPKTKYEENTARVISIWISLPKFGKSLKVARLIMGAKLGLTLSNAINFVVNTIGLDVDNEQKSNIKKIYQEEQNKNDYYKTKNHNNFPINMEKDEAWKIIKLKFPHPPYVHLNDEIENQINTLLKQDAGTGDVQAVSLIRKATQYDIAAAKALAVLKKLEMYAGDEVTDDTN